MVGILSDADHLRTIDYRMIHTTHDAFDAAYAQLNPLQKEAVDTTEGPVMVIAGPGTGKTQILALRIANILRATDTQPENILALTFTDAGAHAMRARLERYIGQAAYHIPVHTFHSFAGDLVRKYPDAYPRIIGGRAANDIEKLSIVQNIIDSGHFTTLRPFGDPMYYVKKIPGAIADLKKDYVTPDILAERIVGLEADLADEPQFHEKGAHKGKVRGAYADKEKRITRLRELLHAYRLYEAALAEARLYDFEDMIVETVRALSSNEDMLRDVQELYQYVLADEHQDVNESQNRILELLASYHDRPNIFVVGDEKQAIYRFQGASLDNFLFFEDRFTGTKTISLTENYRSTQTILDAAHSLIKTDDEHLARLRVPLRAAGRATDGVCEARTFAHEAVEDTWVIDAVRRAREAGTPAEEIAIIARKNRDVEHYAALLRRHTIPVLPSADSDILQHPITQAIDALIRAVVRVDDERALFDVLHAGYWNIDAGDLARVFAGRTHTWPLAKIIGDVARLRELKVADAAPFLRVAEVLSGARSQEVTQAPHYVIEYLMTESGFLAHAIKTDPGEGVRVLRRIYDDIEGMVVRDHTATLSAVATQLEYRRTHGLALTAPFIGSDTNAVRVMTAHKSKGLEFDTVIIPHVNDSAWGGSSGRDLFKLPLVAHERVDGIDAEDDERRLLYVAMTRAKRNLYLNYAETNQEGKLLEPSRFLGQISTDYLLPVATDAEAAAFDPAALFGAAPAGLRIDAALVRELFLTRGFSVTHLNNYLQDPWLYFYRNLLKIPEPRGMSLMYGEAVHEVLERAVMLREREERMPTDTEVSKWLEYALMKLPIAKTEYPQLHERGFAALIAYLPHLAATIGARGRPEFSVSATLKTGDPELPEIPLTGKLDRVDYDENGVLFRVLDYKTGKAKTKNEIVGNTATSDGGYKRQLVFYALLLSLYDPERPQPREFTLSFVEPNARSGEISEYTCTIGTEEIEALRSEIVRVAKEIATGAFFDVAPKDPSVIPYR